MRNRLMMSLAALMLTAAPAFASVTTYSITESYQADPNDPTTAGTLTATFGIDTSEQPTYRGGQYEFALSSLDVSFSGYAPATFTADLASSYYGQQYNIYAGVNQSFLSGYSVDGSQSLELNLGTPDSESELQVVLVDSGYSVFYYNDYESELNLTQVVDVPEPASFAILGLGLVGLSALRRRA